MKSLKISSAIKAFIERFCLWVHHGFCWGKVHVMAEISSLKLQSNSGDQGSSSVDWWSLSAGASRSCWGVCFYTKVVDRSTHAEYGLRADRDIASFFKPVLLLYEKRFIVTYNRRRSGAPEFFSIWASVGLIIRNFLYLNQADTLFYPVVWLQTFMCVTEETMWTWVLGLCALPMTTFWRSMIYIHIMYFLALLWQPAWETCRDRLSAKSTLSICQPLTRSNAGGAACTAKNYHFHNLRDLVLKEQSVGCHHILTFGGGGGRSGQPLSGMRLSVNTWHL